MKTGHRHQAREAALQMLYLWEVGRVEPALAPAHYWSVIAGEGPLLSESARTFTERLVAGTIARQAEIDAVIERHAQNWRLSRMAVIDRLILRLATYELLFESGTPAATTIDEALELARTFSEADAIRFVNGILDAIHKQHHE